MKLHELDQDVVRAVDRDFMLNGNPFDVADLIVDFDREIDLDNANEVIGEAIRRFPREDRQDSDMWLGPRLHAALRLTRREAARRGIWRYLGLVSFPNYVRWRWDRDTENGHEPPTLERFVGPDYKHALARLWWMAELFRNGPDYGPAVHALGNQDVANNLFRMDIAHCRPVALSTVKVLRLDEKGNEAIGREANALAKALNVAAGTLAVDVIAPDVPLDENARRAWIDGSLAYNAEDFFDDLPAGPDDPPVPGNSLDSMTQLMTELLASAPIRGR